MKASFFMMITHTQSLCFITITSCAQMNVNKLKILFHEGKKMLSLIAASTAINLFSPTETGASMLTFPLPAPLKNNIVLVRSGESFADSRHEIQTNPVKKLRQDNALTSKGREQVDLYLLQQ